MPTKNRKTKTEYVYIFLIVGIIALVFMIPYILNLYNIPENNIIANENYSITIESEISLRNRNNLNSNEYIDGMIIPHGAGYSTEYCEDFNDDYHNWIANTSSKTISNPERYVFEGSQSYYFSKNGRTQLDQSFQIHSNETFDLSFYIFSDYGLIDGYIAFGYMVSFNNQLYQFEYVLAEAGIGYIKSSSDIINYSITGFVRNYWMGYLLQNIRQSVFQLNNTCDSTDIRLFNPYLKLYENDNQGIRKLYVDLIQFQKYSYNVEEGKWYDKSFQVQTDYQITLAYTIYCDNTVVNADSITLNLQFNEIINNLAQNLTRNIYTKILGNFNWSSYRYGIYNYRAMGSFSSVLLPLPKDSTLGKNLTFTFEGNYNIQADSIDGTVIQESKNKNIAGFSISFMNPIG